MLCNGSSDTKASVLLSSAKQSEGGAGLKGFAFITDAFSGESFERLSESMLVTSPDTVSSAALGGWVVVRLEYADNGTAPMRAGTEVLTINLLAIITRPLLWPRPLNPDADPNLRHGHGTR